MNCVFGKRSLIPGKYRVRILWLFVKRGQNVYVDGGSQMNQILPQFPEYVAVRKLAPAKQIPFLAGWSNKFIRFSNVRHANPSDLNIQLFLDD